MQSDHSVIVKKRALFVLGQIDAPEAQQMLVDFAGAQNAELQVEAIRSIGISGDRDALASLASIYEEGSGPIRQAVLEAYLIADDADAVFAVAERAAAGEDYDLAVKMLGAMGATDHLRKLGATTRSLLDAYMMAGDVEPLIDIASGGGGDVDPKLRIQAMKSIGIVGGSTAIAFLKSRYAGAETPAESEAVLQGLMLAGADEALLELYRSAEDVREKRTIMRKLAMTDGDAVLDAVDAALEGRQP